jgi:ribulose-phosphate 3-epimerase
LIRQWCDLPIDLHIITESPEKYFDLLKENPVKYVTFQFESLNSKLNIPGDIKGHEGLAVTTSTSIDAFDGCVNGEVSFILRNMGVSSSVSGSYLFNAPSIGHALMNLTKGNIEAHFQVGDFIIPLSECPIACWSTANLKNLLETIEIQ